MTFVYLVAHFFEEKKNSSKFRNIALCKILCLKLQAKKYYTTLRHISSHSVEVVDQVVNKCFSTENG